MTKVAVYGSLRSGFHNHSLLNGQEFLGRTKTKNKYAMFSLGGFPKVNLQAPVSQIVVEIYDVDDVCLRRLDSLEGFRGKGASNFYDRSEIETECGQTALIYHIDSNGEYPIASGDWEDGRERYRRFG